jgi:hypothetical protein
MGEAQSGVKIKAWAKMAAEKDISAKGKASGEGPKGGHATSRDE